MEMYGLRMMEHLLYFQTLRGLRFAATSSGIITMVQPCFAKNLDLKMEPFTERDLRIRKMHLEWENAALETL